MRTEKIQASEWKKLSLKKAEYAHITTETIFVAFRDRLQGVEVEYAIEVPNDGFINLSLCQSLDDPVRTYMVNGGFVRYLKDIHSFLHYPKNSLSDSKLNGLGLVLDTVIAQTKKGDISFGTIRDITTGADLHTGDIHATR